MSQDFHIAKFKHIEINDVEIGTLLYSITRNDTSEDFIIPEKLFYVVVDNYKKVYEIFNHYQNFDIEIYTLSFTYNLYLSSVNFKTHNIDYDNININSISYYIMKYLRKAWDIKKKDILKLKELNDSFKPNKNTILTRNCIYDYYTDKFIEAVKNEDYKSKHYYDNEILGNLNFYDNVSVRYNHKYII